MDLTQEDAFGESAMPLMSFIGEAGRSILEPKLTRFAKKWAYPDRLLCWLAPSLRGDVRNFYESNGPDMIALCAKDARDGLDHLDRDLSKLLLERMSRIDRGVTITVIRWLRENGLEIE